MRLYRRESRCVHYALFERLAVLYPEIEEEGGFTQIINERQYDRLVAALEEAKQQGATVHTKQVTNGSDSRLIAPHLLTDVTDDMTIMRDEIFGHCCQLSYRDIQEALDYINSKDRPLALYIMSTDKSLIQRIVDSTHSGGVGINETVFHVGAEDAPFGGIGPSGMGHYHGVEGFRTFSHAKTVFHTPAWLGRIKLLLKSKQKMIEMMGVYSYVSRIICGICSNNAMLSDVYTNARSIA
ncbi:aldehyde dehydrogenase [Vibrio astriarenae]|nr:aldehyde dehydrogenase [Vibrio sp. C7]